MPTSSLVPLLFGIPGSPTKVCEPWWSPRQRCVSTTTKCLTPWPSERLPPRIWMRPIIMINTSVSSVQIPMWQCLTPYIIYYAKHEKSPLNSPLPWKHLLSCSHQVVSDPTCFWKWHRTWQVTSCSLFYWDNKRTEWKKRWILCQFQLQFGGQEQDLGLPLPQRLPGTQARLLWEAGKVSGLEASLRASEEIVCPQAVTVVLQIAGDGQAGKHLVEIMQAWLRNSVAFNSLTLPNLHTSQQSVVSSWVDMESPKTRAQPLPIGVGINKRQAFGSGSSRQQKDQLVENRDRGVRQAWPPVGIINSWLVEEDTAGRWKEHSLDKNWDLVCLWYQRPLWARREEFRVLRRTINIITFRCETAKVHWASGFWKESMGLAKQNLGSWRTFLGIKKLSPRAKSRQHEWENGEMAQRTE